MPRHILSLSNNTMLSHILNLSHIMLHLSRRLTQSPRQPTSHTMLSNTLNLTLSQPTRHSTCSRTQSHNLTMPSRTKSPIILSHSLSLGMPSHSHSTAATTSRHLP